MDALTHLLLDSLDGGPIPLSFQFVELGVGLHYLMQVPFGEACEVSQASWAPPPGRTSPRPGVIRMNLSTPSVSRPRFFFTVYSGQREHGGRNKLSPHTIASTLSPISSVTKLPHTVSGVLVA